MSRTENLEKLVDAYETAIINKDADEIDRLCMAVEQEADRIGYDNHRRLMALHTFAEQSAPTQA